MAGISVLREWVLDNREVKSEDKMPFTLSRSASEKNDLRSRNESEMKMTGNEKASRSRSKISREFSRI